MGNMYYNIKLLTFKNINSLEKMEKQEILQTLHTVTSKTIMITARWRY